MTHGPEGWTGLARGLAKNCCWQSIIGDGGGGFFIQNHHQRMKQGCVTAAYYPRKPPSESSDTLSTLRATQQEVRKVMRFPNRSIAICCRPSPSSSTHRFSRRDDVLKLKGTSMYDAKEFHLSANWTFCSYFFCANFMYGIYGSPLTTLNEEVTHSGPNSVTKITPIRWRDKTNDPPRASELKKWRWLICDSSSLPLPDRFHIKIQRFDTAGVEFLSPQKRVVPGCVIPHPGCSIDITQW